VMSFGAESQKSSMSSKNDKSVLSMFKYDPFKKWDIEETRRLMGQTPTNQDRSKSPIRNTTPRNRDSVVEKDKGERVERAQSPMSITSKYVPKNLLMSTKHSDRPKTPTGRNQSPIKTSTNQTTKNTFKKFDLNFDPRGDMFGKKNFVKAVDEDTNDVDSNEKKSFLIDKE